MNTEYLVAAANEMFKLIVLNLKPSVGDLLKATHIGHETLNALLADTEFFEDVEELAKRKARNREEFDYLTASLTHFVNHFLRLERKLLVAGGLKPELITHLFEEAKEALQSIRAWDGDPQTLRWLLEQLREEICQLERFLDEFQGESELREKWKRKLKRVTFAIGGAAIVGLDASALAATYGITIPGTAVSMAVGRAIIGAAVPAAAGAVAGVGSRITPA